MLLRILQYLSKVVLLNLFRNCKSPLNSNMRIELVIASFSMPDQRSEVAFLQKLCA